jgi:hypothetical protein
MAAKTVDRDLNAVTLFFQVFQSLNEPDSVFRMLGHIGTMPRPG